MDVPIPSGPVAQRLRWLRKVQGSSDPVFMGIDHIDFSSGSKNYFLAVACISSDESLAKSHLPLTFMKSRDYIDNLGSTSIENILQRRKKLSSIAYVVQEYDSSFEHEASVAIAYSRLMCHAFDYGMPVVALMDAESNEHVLFRSMVAVLDRLGVSLANYDLRFGGDCSVSLINMADLYVHDIACELGAINGDLAGRLGIVSSTDLERMVLPFSTHDTTEIYRALEDLQFRFGRREDFSESYFDKYAA